MINSKLLLRGKSLQLKLWMGAQCYPIKPSMVGGQSVVRPGYTHLKHMRPQRPVRAIGLNICLPPVLYNRQDQIVQIENALALSRIENQVSVTLSQLAIGIRNADDFVEDHLLNKEVRPSMHQLWFHNNGLREHQHIVSGLGPHHLVPMFSLISYDVEKGKMQVHEAVELYDELMDTTVAHQKIVQRELTNQMIRVHCLNDDYQRACQVVEEMKRKGIRRTFVSYAPLFRMVRLLDDAEKHIQLVSFVKEMEGGALAKFLWIDVPRSVYMFGVLIRYHWAAIYFTFVTLASAAVYYWYNFSGQQVRLL